MVTNQDLGISALWHFMGGRGGHEKTLGELKQQLFALPARRPPLPRSSMR